MFHKYFMEGLKRSPLKYALLMVCTIAVIVSSIVANGILMDTLSTDMRYDAQHYTFVFPEGKKMGELRDNLREALNKTEPNFQLLWLKPTVSERFSDDALDDENYNKIYIHTLQAYFGTTIVWFPSYQSMRDYFSKYWHVSNDGLPTEEQYNNEKIAILGSPAYYYTDDHQKVDVPYEYADNNHVIIGGEEYMVVGHSPTEGAFVFLTGAPEEAWVRSFEVSFERIPTSEQVEKMSQLFYEMLGSDCKIEEPRTRDLLEIRKSTANIVITALIQIIAVFNILIIYKFIIDSRRKQFAVMRLCGFKKSTCLLYSWSEIAVTTVICLPAACRIFECFVKHGLAESFPAVSVIYTPTYYVALGTIFLVSATVAFMVYIVPTFGKPVTRELLEM